MLVQMNTLLFFQIGLDLLDAQILEGVGHRQQTV